MMVTEIPLEHMTHLSEEEPASPFSEVDATLPEGTRLPAEEPAQEG